MDNFTKYLKILNLKPPLTEDKIKQAYRELVKKNHPDLFESEKNKKLASKKFKLITIAYEYILSNYKSYNKNSKKKSKKNDLQIYKPSKQKDNNNIQVYKPSNITSFDELFMEVFADVLNMELPV